MLTVKSWRLLDRIAHRGELFTGVPVHSFDVRRTNCCSLNDDCPPPRQEKQFLKTQTSAYTRKSQLAHLLSPHGTPAPGSCLVFGLRDVGGGDGWVSMRA